MEAKFPIFDFVKQSFVQTFAYGKGLLITLAAILALVVAAFAVFAIIGVMSSAAGGSTGGMIAGFLIVLVLTLYAMGWIFNYWVRYGAEGRQNLLPDGFAASLTPALATGLKLLFIAILLVIVATVIIMVTGILGLGIPFGEITALTQMGTLETIKALGVVYLIIFGVTCGVYSIFSSNLTKTALGREDEEVGEPHVLEFALVLFLIYAAVYLPASLLQSVMPEIAGLLVEAVSGLLLAALIPVAQIGSGRFMLRASRGGLWANNAINDGRSDMGRAYCQPHFVKRNLDGPLRVGHIRRAAADVHAA